MKIGLWINKLTLLNEVTLSYEESESEFEEKSANDFNLSTNHENINNDFPEEVTLSNAKIQRLPP